MTYRCGLGRPDLFAGLVALSCSIRDQDGMRERLPEERAQPIFIAHGLRDNIERAQSSRDFLVAEGYAPTYNEYDMAHEISPRGHRRPGAVDPRGAPTAAARLEPPLRADTFPVSRRRRLVSRAPNQG